MGDAAVWRALVERDQIIDHGPATPSASPILEETLKHLDGYTLEARATAVLEGLGIPFASHRRPLSTLSGGFKLRVLLAQVLIGAPTRCCSTSRPPPRHPLHPVAREIPGGLPGVALVISPRPALSRQRRDAHPRRRLRDDHEYTGNYTAFVVEKAATRERKEAEIGRAEKAIAEKRAFVERFGPRRRRPSRPRAGSSRSSASRSRSWSHLASHASLSLHACARQRPRGARGEGPLQAYGTQKVLKDVSLAVRRGERVAILGPNGLGKSTLLKIVMAGSRPTKATCASATRSIRATSRRTITRSCATLR